jgi:hypothetical protein
VNHTRGRFCHSHERVLIQFAGSKYHLRSKRNVIFQVLFTSINQKHSHWRTLHLSHCVAALSVFVNRWMSRLSPRGLLLPLSGTKWAAACASTVYDAFRILLLSVSILNLSTSAYLRRTAPAIATDGARTVPSSLFSVSAFHFSVQNAVPGLGRTSVSRRFQGSNSRV